MIKFFICVLVSHLIYTSVSSQSFHGKITDMEGRNLQDAFIFTSSHNIHTHSDALGKFVLRGVSIGDTVIVSFLGYKLKETVVDNEHLENSVVIVLEEESYALNQVLVTGGDRSVHRIANIDLQISNVRSSQEILRQVPGLFIAQHAGGGKAEQIFLRGFDIDHGTDITISVENLPVNMVSHAHGQGYSDLHFLIPELIKDIDFGKGPYYIDKGNFNTAGYVQFNTKNEVQESIFGLDIGKFGTARLYGVLNVLDRVEGHNAYLAGEYLLSDGYFESPQNFHRFNLMGKYTVNLPGDDQLSLLFSNFKSRWNASGQIPLRLVNSGKISRFGSVDDTEGGNTDRTNLLLELTKSIGNNSFIKNNFWFSNYNFDLYSNFTFFLIDPLNGDQIRQKENRNIFGLESVFHQPFYSNKVDILSKYGLGVRYDDINNNELSRTANRTDVLSSVSLNNIDELNIYSFAGLEIEYKNWTFQPGLRLDLFNFELTDGLNLRANKMSENALFLAPKFNIFYNVDRQLQLYLKSGRGFHSNDARVIFTGKSDKNLPAAIGVDVGVIWKPIPDIYIDAALWQLNLEEEFVYIGDVGIIEPSGKTIRRGLDFGMRYRANNNFYIRTDLTYTYARMSEEESGHDFIPLAPDFTATGGVNYHNDRGWSGALSYRFIKDRPAISDRSVIAEGYFLVDAKLNYELDHISFGLSVENLFNVTWNEAQFASETRLKNELTAVEELHFTPGTPFFLKGSIRYNF